MGTLCCATIVQQNRTTVARLLQPLEVLQFYIYIIDFLHFGYIINFIESIHRILS